MLNPFRKKKSPKTKGTEVLRRLQELDGQAKRTNQGESASSGLALKPAKATIENETGASSFPAESAMHGADAGSNLDNKDSPAQKLDFDIAEMEPTNLGSGALSASHCSESDAGVPANNSDATDRSCGGDGDSDDGTETGRGDEGGCSQVMSTKDGNSSDGDDVVLSPLSNASTNSWGEPDDASTSEDGSSVLLSPLSDAAAPSEEFDFSGRLADEGQSDGE